VGEADAESPRPLRRRMAYVHGQWQVTYLCSGEPGPETDLRCGVIAGPLVPDLSTALWIAVVPDGSIQRTMIRRDSITNITPPPRHGQ
jgi:hypothetical protein